MFIKEYAENKETPNYTKHVCDARRWRQKGQMLIIKFVASLRPAWAMSET